MKWRSASVTLGLALLAACGGKAVIDVEDTTTTSTTTTTTTTTSPVACGGLDYCTCYPQPGCEVVYGGCICGCDYECPGEPPCACDCGGGPYHGCAPASCPGPFAFGELDYVAFDAEGCPYVVPPPP
ncbi:MAG: hypothetical protein IT373_00225 [Polyangiaceae bacterium]|nr:hypothetical protein [Polyangiaceae bacterium]